jgi:hypothetical protein
MSFKPVYKGQPEVRMEEAHFRSIQMMVNDLFPGFEVALGKRGEVYLSSEIGGHVRRWFPDGATQEMKDARMFDDRVSERWLDAMKYVEARNSARTFYSSPEEDGLCLVEE